MRRFREARRRAEGVTASAGASVDVVSLSLGSVSGGESEGGVAGVSTAARGRRVRFARDGAVVGASASLALTSGSSPFVGVSAEDSETVSDAFGVVFGVRCVRRRRPVESGMTAASPAVGSGDGIAALRHAAVDRRSHSAGSVLDQGDVASGAATARQRLGVSGKGVKVGILSDSFECLGTIADDVATGDLPVDTAVLPEQEIGDCSGGEDEGRAMAQIVHDLAPDASIRFCSAFNGFVQFAECIDLLVQDGCDIIVDDVIYFNEAMFQDDLIAQAADRAAAAGVAYFSAALNFARQSYEAPFVPGEDYGGVVQHAFDGVAGSDQPFQIIFFASPTEGPLIILNWDDPSPSATPSTADDNQPLRSEVFVCFDIFDTGLNEVGNDCIFPDSNDPKLGFDLSGLSVGVYFLDLYVLAATEAPLPGRIKLFYDGDLEVNPETDTRSSTLFGHPNAAGAMAVGAVFYKKTPAFGQSPPVLELFSSAGGTPILFDVNGVRLSTPTDRRKPEISCIDGADTTFFPPGGRDVEDNGFPNFFGTSAAAPHAAAIAALMLDAQPTLTVQEIYSTLKNTAIDMGVAGFDYDSGAGLCNAPEAVQAASNTRPSVTAESDGSALTLCIAHGTVSTGACSSNNQPSKRKRVVTATGITRVSVQTHLNYARLEHKSDSNCGPSVTLRVDNRIVWKSSTTKFTRTGSVDGNALVDLADGTHTATLSISLEKCHDARFSVAETAIVCTRVADVESIKLRGALLDDDTSSDFSSSS